jgi:hypothetical protein
LTLEEYEIWKKEQEVKRFEKRKEEKQKAFSVIIDYYLSGQHKQVKL